MDDAAVPVDAAVPECDPAVGVTRYVAKDGADSGDCVSEACLTISYATGQLESGDVLEIGDGIYTENPWAGVLIPSGPGTGACDARFTVIRAQNPGQTVVDGGATGAVVRWFDEVHHIKFDGILFTHSRTAQALVQVADPASHHIYFRRCGFYRTGGGGASTVWSNASYQLYEECYFYGSGRYGLNLRTPGDYSVVRRCVFRLDNAEAGGLVIAAAISYEHDYVEWQNNIVIDTDRDDWSDYTYPMGGLITHKTADGDGTHYNSFRGNIILNNDFHHVGSADYGFGIALDGATTTNCLVENNVIWDLAGHGIHGGGSGTVGNVARGNTVGAISDPSGVVGDGIRYFEGDGESVIRNIVYDCRDDGLLRVARNDYNCVFGNGDDLNGCENDPETHGMSYDPRANGLLHLPAVESGSRLHTDGGEAPIGAVILKRYGLDGTFHGEPGYDTLSDEDLWPFPYEETIRAHMRTNTPSTGPDGARGFCADGRTLTTYIWEYLGTACPTEICGP